MGQVGLLISDQKSQFKSDQELLSRECTLGAFTPDRESPLNHLSLLERLAISRQTLLGHMVQ